MANTQKLNYSPSVCHRHIMKNINQTMAYKGQDVKVWQSRLRRKLRQLVGIVQEKKTNLNVRHLWKKQHKFGTIEKIVFTSEPFSNSPNPEYFYESAHHVECLQK